MEPPQTSIGISEGLDRSFNFSEVFQLVKKSVKTSIGKRRTGLMLGLADLPEYICAFHLGPDHPATRLAADGPSIVFPEITFQHHTELRSRRLPKFEIVREFEKEYKSYVA